MLSVVLVLFVVTSALAAPTVSIDQYLLNEIPRPKDNGRLSFLTERAFELTDGGDTNVYILTAQQIINDLANQADQRSQAMALGHVISILLELSTGNTGDVCAVASFIDAYTAAARSGNFAGVRPAFVNYIRRFANAIDLIVKLAIDPNSARYANGAGSGCRGGGKLYNFDAAWDIILANDVRYLDELHCTSKSLYSALNSRSNNVGALLTAGSMPPTVQVLEHSIGQISNFLRVVASGNRNPAAASAAAASAKSALIEAANRVQL